MTPPQIVLYLVLISIIVILVPMAALVMSAIIAYRQGKYLYFVKVIRRLPVIVDRDGVISPEMAVAAAVRAGDYQFAAEWLSKASRQGVLPIHYLLEISLMSQQGQWEKASQIFALLSNGAASMSQDVDTTAQEDMAKLAGYIEAHDAAKIDEMSRKEI